MGKRINGRRSSDCAEPGWANLTRAMVCMIALGVFVCPGFLFAHPHSAFEIVLHEHPALGLVISIENERVVYDISLSNGFLNTLIPHERGHLNLKLVEDTFEMLDLGQQAAEQAAFATFFEQLPPVEINDLSANPQLESFKYVRSSASADLAISETLPPDARVQVVFQAPTTPRNVRLTWNIFANEYSVDAFGDPVDPSLAARLDTPSQSRIVTFTQETPTLEWNRPDAPADQRIAVSTPAPANEPARIPMASLAVLASGIVGAYLCNRLKRPMPLRIVILSVALAASIQMRSVGTIAIGKPASPPTDGPMAANAPDIFESLLKNIYRAFEFRNESDVYDVLEQSVDGPLLDRVYKEVQAGLVSADQNGAIAKVKSVEILKSELTESTNVEGHPFQVRGQWRVDGMVYHWGHVHDTSNIFEAVYTLAPCDGFWKIVKTELLSSEPET